MEYGDEFQQDMNLEVEKIPSYPCSFCIKVYLTKVGLTRHVSTKHHLEKDAPNIEVSKMLHPDILSEIRQKRLKKLAQDGCYPEKIAISFEALEWAVQLPIFQLTT